MKSHLVIWFRVQSYNNHHGKPKSAVCPTTRVTVAEQRSFLTTHTHTPTAVPPHSIKRRHTYKTVEIAFSSPHTTGGLAPESDSTRASRRWSNEEPSFR